MADKMYFYVISDSLGDTNQTVINAVMAQFPQITDAEIKRYPLVRDLKTLEEVLHNAADDDAVIITTLVQDKLLAFATTFAQEHKLKHLDVMHRLMQLVQEKSGFKPIEKPGSQHKLNDSYYERMNAINFASKYDDGKDPRGFLKADLIVIGPSRTSKTPLSIYLANKSIKTANLPLIPEVNPPEEIYQVNPKRIVGVVADPGYMQRVRTSRLEFLGLKAGSSYSDIMRIKAELVYARKVMDDLHAPIFDITNQTIEETASKILHLLPELKDISTDH